MTITPFYYCVDLVCTNLSFLDFFLLLIFVSILHQETMADPGYNNFYIPYEYESYPHYQQHPKTHKYQRSKIYWNNSCKYPLWLYIEAAFSVF